MTTATVFDLASLTKPVATARLVMQLAAASKIVLDVKLMRYLPAIAKFNHTPTVAARDAAGGLRASCSVRICTVRAFAKPADT
jgi:CubicO group peptidase (beta-lactamase class C family)